MNSENTEHNLDQEAPLLSGIGATNPFCVPDNYFESSLAQINSLVNLEKLKFTKEDISAVPENYFETLSDRIHSAIALDSLKEKFDGDGFTVPANYFVNLNDKISEKIIIESGVKPKVRRLSAPWLKYATAACVTMIIGSVAFFNMNQNSVDKQLGKIPEEEIINYLQIHSDVGDTPAILENLGQNVDLADMNSDISPKDIQDYINSTL